jgi:hypothetical protein
VAGGRSRVGGVPTVLKRRGLGLARRGGLLAVLALTGWLAMGAVHVLPLHAGAPTRSTTDNQYPWRALIPQAERMGLPTRFLRAIPPEFFTVEFADLRAFAAEYHPEDHRMILNRALSFNAAGGVLRPLTEMTRNDAATLYHELFHAYMDYLSSRSDQAAVGPEGVRLMAFARAQQQCRYQSVTITPLRQRRGVTEPRFLSDGESWEALNETWAVFVGWAIWAQLGLAHEGRRVGPETWTSRSDMAKLLKKADKNGELVGYYEPEDDDERRVTNKRHLAPSHRISPAEVAVLLELLFGVSPGEAQRVSALMSASRQSPERGEACISPPSS